MTTAEELGLERSCADDWVKVGASRPGFERIEARFRTHAFVPHRHDTYAIGITLRGVQSFGYRGTTEHSTTGHALVIHPDEKHDGRAGTAEGFHYRILYVAPRLIADALPRGSALPFVRDAVTPERRLHGAITAALDDFEMPLEDLQFDDMVARLAEALAAHDPASRHDTVDVVAAHAVRAARDYLDAHVLDAVASSALERITGLSRFALSRHFRAHLGTSPHRYVVMRRLERARDLMRDGTPPVAAALDSGFADQSHMARHFKRTYGLTPGRWRALGA